jgi:hypothetical protein
MIAIECKCGNGYQLDDKHAGRRLRCRNCGAVIAVPALVMSTSHSENEQSTPKPAISPSNHYPAEPGSDTPKTPDEIATRIDNDSFLQYENRGRYHFVRGIAEGGMGKVNLARDMALKRNVALKELLDGIADVPNIERRFIAEAEITGQLEHPGIVPIYALGVNAQGKPFYAMRFVEGQTLKAGHRRVS